MKKLLGISLVAVLSAMPVMAFAGPQDSQADCLAAEGTWTWTDEENHELGGTCSDYIVTPAAPTGIAATDPGATTANAPTAAYAPKYALKAAAQTDGNVASAGYVKGAYNAAIKAINKTADVLDTAIDMLDDGANGYDINAKTLKVQGADVATQTGVVNTIKSASVTSALTNTGNVAISTTVPVMDDWATDVPAANGIPISANVDLTGVGVSSTITVDDYHTTYVAP